MAATLASLIAPAYSAQILWPQNRTAYAAYESIEVAVVDLGQGQEARVELRPKSGGTRIASFALNGAATLPPFTVAPGDYDVLLDGNHAGTLKIVSGVWRSSTLLSATSITAPDGGNNAVVGNLFGFGLRDAQGQPLEDVRGKKSPGMAAMENWLSSGLPTLMYMYWTGFVTHKPWGSEKSWANAQMQESMRLFNFANAQRMRQYAPAIAAVGPIDEPGLGWGKTPAGGIASGFPNSDEKPWYESRGWKYTQDVAAQSDADWLRYVSLRAGILEESYRQANRDLKTVWPGAVFEGDLYAPSAIMDGTDPLNQRANDTPTSHVFFDFFGGPMSVPGLLSLEKSHDPSAKIAHAMNGQLVGERGPQLPLYHELMNAMLMGGIKSNWWLNTGVLTREELAAVQAPAEQFGPWIQNMQSRADVALLWGRTELALREKQMAANESAKRGGEQIKLMVPLPQGGEMAEAELASNAYEVGGTYANQVVYTHQALLRAGYPTHIIHEATLPEGALKGYKALVITGQHVAFPPEVRAAIDQFVRQGGHLIIDRSTTINLPGAIVHEAKLSEADLRSWTAQLEHDAKAAATPLERSRFNTIGKVIEPAIQAVPPLKATLAKAGVVPAILTNSQDLAVARYEGGEGSLVMVLNGHEELPPRETTQAFPRYNPAPLQTTYRLGGVPKGSVVYASSGLNWATQEQLKQVSVPLKGAFAAGEMKLYVIAPKAPKALTVSAQISSSCLRIHGQLSGLKMPWPLRVEVKGPAGEVLYSLFRATGRDGLYDETLPLGANAPAGAYGITLSSPVAGLKGSANVLNQPSAISVIPMTESVQVFDEPAIRSLLNSKAPIVIAVGEASQQPIADSLAGRLTAAGIPVQVRGETDVLRKVSYPRIWNASVQVYSPTGKDPVLPAGAQVSRRVTLSVNEQGVETATGAEGEWRQPNTLVTIAGSGYVDWVGQDHEVVYQPGTSVFVDDKRQLLSVSGESKEVETTPEFREHWSRPWTNLTSYGGTYQLPPQLPEAYSAASNLIVLGDSHNSQIARVLQASEILPRVVDAQYPGQGKSLLQFAWSPFAVEKNVIFVGASDTAGLEAGADRLLSLLKP